MRQETWTERSKHRVKEIVSKMVERKRKEMRHGFNNPQEKKKQGNEASTAFYISIPFLIGEMWTHMINKLPTVFRPCFARTYRRLNFKLQERGRKLSNHIGQNIFIRTMEEREKERANSNHI